VVKRSSPRPWQEDTTGSSDAIPRSADPQATQKISREELDAVLKRTKSGTRRAVRSEPEVETPRDSSAGEVSGARAIEPLRSPPAHDVSRESLPGPRDDSPEISIMRIDSVELSAIDPASLPAPAPQASPMPFTPMTFKPLTPASASPLAPIPTPNPRPAKDAVRRVRTRRASILSWIAIVISVAAAMFVAFFAGRLTARLR
jgi:hypothetical protein